MIKFENTEVVGWEAANCRDYDEQNKFCRDLGKHVLDNTFCCWGEPDMSKKPNVKEEK